MSAESAERTVLPPAGPLDNLVDLFSRTQRSQAKLVGPSGEHISIPPELFEVLRAVVTAMANGQAVTVAPHNQTLTTQEAADLLGVSRPTLVRLLEDGEIPFEQPGRHRRLLLRDLLDYQDRRRHRRREALDELVELSEDADLYENTTTPIS
ncbi:helix-turn-helix domain-containing protein [Actinomadura alba]|uniref:Helix-turn-helix domain-containing protein n=1 Tax=Actinomadura alba TaxID=406431 RepID=A0ABR7M1T4_9ACTN|nr:helix-turn-helix domain-containing protein [Actinomadura alba]MBC6471080.1 helix-turn-helix domain-containing protein [Actinomadura alba]